LAAGMKMAVFWVIVSCSVIEVHWHFRGACCIHHHGSARLLPGCTAKQPRKQPSSKFYLTVDFFLSLCFFPLPNVCTASIQQTIHIKCKHYVKRRKNNLDYIMNIYSVSLLLKIRGFLTFENEEKCLKFKHSATVSGEICIWQLWNTLKLT
jgi:hypothetical protein